MDSNHISGLKILSDIQNEQYGKEYFITDYIFDETLTAIFRKIKNKKEVTRLGNHLLNVFNMLSVTKVIFMKAFELFSEDNKLSFTDCVIITMANEYSIDHIATFDKEIKKHFKNCVDS
jgi:predicted nucleic acid-binding protein